MMPNSVASGSATSLATIEIAEEKGWPTRRLRTISSIASGSCSSSMDMRFLALALIQTKTPPTPMPKDTTTRTGRAVPVPSVSPTKAKTAIATISMISCLGVKAIAAFCALSDRIE